MTKEEIFAEVSSMAPLCEELASELFDDPEISGEEARASERFRKLMSEEGFKIIDEPRMPYAFCAEYGSGSPVLCFAGEYDALPGLSQKVKAVKEAVCEDGPGHGCGHNLLGTGAAIAAIAVKRYLERSKVQGTVRFYGCPAEETSLGKTLMAYYGMFEGGDFCLAWHPMSANRVLDTAYLAVAQEEFHFTGRSSHAGSAPEDGRSALDAMELMSVGANYLREHIPDRSRIHYTTYGNAYPPNIVPPKASALYWVRARNIDIAKDILRRLELVAKGAAMMTETQVDCEVLIGNCELATNHSFADLLYENMLASPKPEYTAEEEAFAREISGTIDPKTVEREKNYYGGSDTALFHGVSPRDTWSKVPVNAGSDVGDVSYIMPTCTMEVACWALGCAPHTWQAAACSGSSFGRKGALYAASVLAGTAYDLYNAPERCAAIKEEFARTVTSAYTPMLNEKYKTDGTIKESV